MITLDGLRAGYGKKIILSDISFSVAAGEVVTLIGPNGAGKSTILKTITGQLKSLGGTVSVLDRNLLHMSPKELARHISMVMTERVNPELMICREVVSTGRYPYTGSLGILGESDWNAVDGALATVHGETLSDTLFTSLSDGQKQRIMLARAIAQDTEVIILDEPTSYLDLYYKLDLMRIIRRLAREQHKAVIMSLHELDLVKMVADTVICVDGEKVLKKGPPAEVFSGNFIQMLYGLHDADFDPATGTLVDSQPADCQPTPAAQTSDSRQKERKTKVLMVQGTMSNAGKSLVVAGLCRVFRQDGYRVAPFKSQNMALNSFITRDGYEMGRAQVMQAEACGIEPRVEMNPILLKPTSDKGSQVIVNGEVLGNMPAREYFDYKPKLIPDILAAYHKLEETSDIIVIEGAGSPAEINLRKNDIVNMGMAELVDAPVILVGDIDRGGVFAQLCGTVELLQKEARQRIQGLVINKFRGDKSLLDPGIDMLEARCHIPVTGVLPYLRISVDDEDSLSTRFDKKEPGLVNIGVIRLPRISNFTDFGIFEQIEGVTVQYVSRPEELNLMDMVIIPGSKNTIGDLKWMRESGMEAAVKKAAESRPLFGICGGYQMLGTMIHDPDGVEEGGSIRGLELLQSETMLLPEKKRMQVQGTFGAVDGLFAGLSGRNYRGYEIHMGQTTPAVSSKSLAGGEYAGNVYGSYIHGLFDEDGIALEICQTLARQKGTELSGQHIDVRAFKERQYDILADAVREHMDMKAIYAMMGIER